jgi:uncharacterized RDD family membrane protein YckC
MSSLNDPSKPFRSDANPYQPLEAASPYQHSDGFGKQRTSGPMGQDFGGQTITLRLASLWQRFAGFLIDTFFPLLFVIPGSIPIAITVFRLVAEANANPGQTTKLDSTAIAMLSVGGGIILVGGLLMLILQIYLLWTRSQTLGKYFVKAQVVDFETGKPANFLSCGVLRILVNGLISNLPCIGFIYGIADTLFIFRDDRRCIHDLIASTTVVDISDQ